MLVGGSALLAGLATALDAGRGAALSLAVGLVMMGWIAGEYLLPDIRFGLATFDTWMQPFYLLVGLAMAALALSVLSDSRRGLRGAARPG
ncbi:MAG TPA: hypothetical protein VFD01_23270 [Candidatus Dormibacteraeota bacterium]|nr:hypothetical protein [Candidatus Dormibacteraeota bacterium]